MSVSRATVGAVVVVIAVLVLSSMGIASAAGGTAVGSAQGSASSAPAPTRATSSINAPSDAGPNANVVPSSSAGPSPFPAPPTPGAELGAKSDASTSLGASIMSTLSAKHIPTHDIYLPDFVAAAHPDFFNGHINVSAVSGPAAYGIGEYGLKNVSGVITPYTLSTPSVEANFSTTTLSGYSPDISSPDEWGVQLNAVLNNVTILGQKGYQFWTQNVFFYSPAIGAVEFVSNIWNFSNRQTTLDCNSIYQSNLTCVPGVYAYASTSFIKTTEPFHLQLYLNSSLVGGRDAVYFNYSVTSGLGTQSGNYSYAIFNSLAPGGNPTSTKAPAYVANGFSYDPAGLPDDFEVMLGGPGGGSNFDMFESDATYLTLQFWNASSGGYTTVPSAYNVGGDTGESSVGVNAAWSQFGHGLFPTACVACVTLSNGPSFVYGLWGVRGSTPAGNIVPEIDWPAQSAPFITVDPPNAFVFIAEGYPFTTWVGTNWSLFQWVPNFAPDTDYTDMPVGNYTIVVVLANYDAEYTTFSLTTDTSYPSVPVALTADTTYGVDTPLWAFNTTGLAAISSGTDAYGDEILYNNEYAQVGQLPLTSTAGKAGNAAYFPWFGEFNVYGFPVFPGILLEGLTDVDVLSAPSFSVTAPAGPFYQFVVNYFGLPETNSLQSFFWGDSGIRFSQSTVTGWFPAASDFGPSQSFASVVFWNTSFSVISTNTFEVGGMGLFLYGGIYNTIMNNTFVTGATPISANPYATAAEYYGAIGLVDADWGDADGYGADAAETCDVCDVVYNNAFDTVVTATSLFYDPYTSQLPNQYPYEFSQAWNIPYEAGPTNIIDGHYLGGNYWWDYGYANNPYGLLPDGEWNYLLAYEFGTYPAGWISGDSYDGGDFYPLVNVPLYNVTFKEHGLPTGVYWDVYVYIPPEYNFQYDYAYNWSFAPAIINFTESAGTWTFYPYSNDKYFAPTTSVGTVTVNETTGNVVVTVDFVAAYVLTIKETGLPLGTDWYGETYAPSTGYRSEDSPTGTETNVSGLIPGTYSWWAYTYGSASGKYRAIPPTQTITISANATVDVTFVPVYTLSVQAIGLPTDAVWSFVASGGGYNYSYSSAGAWINISTASTTYAWTASSAGFVATPSHGSLDLTANTTLTVTFQAGAGLTFTESGLPTGTSWTVALTQGSGTTTLGSTGASIVFSAVLGAYNYAVSSTGYAATPGTGSGTLTGNTTIAVVFAAATGTLSGTLAPSAGALWVDGAQETLGSGGTFSLTLPVGTHTIEASASGYATYFNNVTVALGKTTTLTIALTSISTSTSSSGISSTGWLLIAVLAALAVLFLVTTLVFARRRGRQPPPMAPYSPAPAAPAAGAPPAGAAQPWQESPPPPGAS